MVSTATTYFDDRHRAYPGEGLDGVVRVSAGGYYGTGSLLYDGRAILTAAHVVDGVSASDIEVYFETTEGRTTLEANAVSLSPGYDAVDINNDLALVWLSAPAPSEAERYDLYRSFDEVGQSMLMVGYGLPGNGYDGMLDTFDGPPTRLMAWNRFDADMYQLKTTLGFDMSWTPLPGTQLAADFDNGLSSQDALGRLIGVSDLGQGVDEGMIAPGDSGGPAFIAGKVAGIASYGASLGYGNITPDVDEMVNSSFGEIGAWQRVSHYQAWIDQSLRAHYPDAPSRPEDVEKSVKEGDAGTTYAYFLVQFTGVRTNPEDWLSVDYATRDGTARAGEDYLPVSGKLVLYPNENYAVIPVEIVGDEMYEPDEFFYLDIRNPVGGSFGEGVSQLSAMRTIVNDDIWWGMSA